MRLCSLCGATMVQRTPDGGNRLRYVCDAYHTVHHRDPRIVAGSLPVWDDQVLLCHRVIAPRLGYWALPTGFVESGETLAQAAARETEEEINAQIGSLQLYTLFNLSHISQVYLSFRAELLDLDFFTGGESLEVWPSDEVEIPWSELTFLIIGRTLKYYFGDRREGYLPVCNEAIAPVLASYKKD